MRACRPPRRGAAALAGLSCLLLPLLAHVPKAAAAGSGDASAPAMGAGPGAMAAAPYEYLGRGDPHRDRVCGPGAGPDACSGVAQSPYEFTKIVVQYQG